MKFGIRSRCNKVVGATLFDFIAVGSSASSSPIWHPNLYDLNKEALISKLQSCGYEETKWRTLDINFFLFMTT